MSNIIEINDLNSKELDVYARLTGAQLRNKLDEEMGIIIAESPSVIEVALSCGYKPISLLTDKRIMNGDVKRIIEKCGDIPIYTAERDTLASITGFELTRGALCALKRPRAKKYEEIISCAKRIAVLESITDSTNIGAIFRSAASLGIDAVLITPTCCDPYCRRAVRVSMGTVFQVPFATVGENKEDWPLPEMGKLKKMGFKTVAMALTDKSVSIDDADLLKEEKLAIILGTEGTGLVSKTIETADYTARIPMSHGVDSLNVGAAAAVAFWQLRAK